MISLNGLDTAKEGRPYLVLCQGLNITLFVAASDDSMDPKSATFNDSGFGYHRIVSLASPSHFGSTDQ